MKNRAVDRYSKSQANSTINTEMVPKKNVTDDYGYSRSISAHRKQGSTNGSTITVLDVMLTMF
jgi:hypothetical protein